MDAAEDISEEDEGGLLAAVGNPAVTGGSPVPEDLEPPAAPAPVYEGPEAPISLDELAATPSPVPATVMPAPATAGPGSKLGTEDTIRRQGELDTQKAEAEAASAEAQSAAAREKDENARLAYADYLDRRKASEERLDALTKQFQETKITNPRERTPKWKSTLSVIFGALGGAHDGSNVGLDALKAKWKEDLDLQKANIDALKDKVVMARTGLKDVDEGRQQMQLAADAAYIARLNSAIKQGELQLKKLGVPQAAINTDQRLSALKADRAEALAKARKAQDEHDLAQARAYYYRHGGNNAGGGGTGGGRDIAVATYLIQNPGDIPGAMKVAGPGFDSKKFDKIVANTKGTEGQNKNAQQAQIGLNAIDAIEKAGYKPTREEIQKWINNQRLAAGAAEHSLRGAALTAGQFFNLVPQSEVEGLSPQAQEYFANVRRYVEPIARSQSGAAISASEWENFFNQYGPNSSGGLKAAKKYLETTARVSGVAGRSLGQGGEGGPPKADPKLEAARRVVADKQAPAAARERAQAYIDAQGK